VQSAGLGGNLRVKDRKISLDTPMLRWRDAPEPSGYTFTGSCGPFGELPNPAVDLDHDRQSCRVTKVSDECFVASYRFRPQRKKEHRAARRRHPKCSFQSLGQ